MPNRSYESVVQYRKMRKVLARDNSVHLLVAPCGGVPSVLACSASLRDIPSHNVYLADLFLAYTGSACKECLDYYLAFQIAKNSSNAIARSLNPLIVIETEQEKALRLENYEIWRSMSSPAGESHGC